MGALRYAQHYWFELHKQRNNTKETQNVSKSNNVFFQKMTLVFKILIFSSFFLRLISFE
jgi:hypothetical protein